MKQFIKVIFIFGIISLVLKNLPAHAQIMNDYCITPPFVVAGVKPNLLLMIDNSASMYDLAYISTTNEYCYDTSYDNSKDYAGYFSKIDESGVINYPIYRYSVNRFIEVASMPGTCTYGGSSSLTPFVCINIADVASKTTVTDFIASGRFLNWLSSSKFDVQKQALTGGKYDSGQAVLIGESRGCLGRRFVKRIPDFADITFAVRGPNALEPDYTNPETQGGLTRIEIFKGTYNNDRCQDAIDTWADDDPLGQWTNAARDCLGISEGSGTASGRELATFIESVRDCYQIKNNIEDIEAGKRVLTEENLFKNVTINNLETQCTNVYTKDCPNPNDLTTCESILNNEAGGNYICARTVTHIAPSPPYYDYLGSDTTGFVGRCWNGSADKFVGGDTCVKRELLHYCSGYSAPEVIDPSGGASSDSADNVPAVIRDASVRSLGDPLPPDGSEDDVFYVKVSTEPPEGLIQKFEGLIRFGAMSFNFNGSDEECMVSGSNISCPKVCSITATKSCAVDSDCPAGETCINLPNADGGQIIHYIKNVCSVSLTTCKTDQDCTLGEQCISQVGDHLSGLIKSIDDIQATSWTPFAEAFHDAIGYFAQRTDLRIAEGNYFTESENINYPDPVQYRCQDNYILIISDGMSTADLDTKLRNTV